MYQAALIVFREVLEAALIITIILAATQTVPRRGLWVSLGILGGITGACIVASFAHILTSLFDGAGQEIVNASILFIAVLMISWHVAWMNSHGRQMASDMREVGRSVAEGEKHMSVLGLVIGLAVMREGSEIVLMLQGLWATSGTLSMLGGGALGLAAGVIVSTLMYIGFLALPISRVFALTNILLVLIAAGMAARAANFLVQAGLVSSLGNRLWDTSKILPDQSGIGQMLAALTGYIARPSGIEVLVYAITVLLITALMWTVKQRTSMQTTAAKAVLR